jgi:hypothetical protein
MGASLAPKSTVPAVTCWMPPPDPIDWNRIGERRARAVNERLLG